MDLCGVVLVSGCPSFKLRFMEGSLIHGRRELLFAKRSWTWAAQRLLVCLAAIIAIW
jgi:hypothetical protein